MAVTQVHTCKFRLCLDQLLNVQDIVRWLMDFELLVGKRFVEVLSCLHELLFKL